MFSLTFGMTGSVVACALAFRGWQTGKVDDAFLLLFWLAFYAGAMTITFAILPLVSPRSLLTGRRSIGIFACGLLGAIHGAILMSTNLLRADLGLVIFVALLLAGPSFMHILPRTRDGWTRWTE